MKLNGKDVELAEINEAIQGLLKKGLVEKVIVDGVESYKLTPLGKQVTEMVTLEPEVDPSSLN